jgi:hypothetical protein
MTLTSLHLEFSATAATPLELDDQAGSSIRGAIVGSLWDRFCANKAAPACAGCPLLQVCPVARLVAPMREDGDGSVEQRPRPYVTRPPLRTGRYAPGEQVRFGLALFGPAAELFPYLVLAAGTIEQQGLGRPLRANGGRRGRLRLSAIEAVQPLTGERQALLLPGGRHVDIPALLVTPEDVRAYAAGLPAERLAVRLHTPLRLVEKRAGASRLVKRFEPRPFFARLAWRLDQLARDTGALPISDHARLPALLERVAVARDTTRWVDVVSYSSRTRSRTPIGGLVGSVMLAGDLAPLRELLTWGSLVHVGRNAVKGDGWYTLDPAAVTSADVDAEIRPAC